MVFPLQCPCLFEITSSSQLLQPSSCAACALPVSIRRRTRSPGTLPSYAAGQGPCRAGPKCRGADNSITGTGAESTCHLDSQRHQTSLCASSSC